MILHSILDAFPNPWNWRFLALAVAASVAATIAASLRADSTGLFGGLIVLAVSVMCVIAGQRFVKGNTLNSARFIRRLFGPLLLGVPPLVAGFVMGTPGAGGYPAALAILLGYVLVTTRDLEHRAAVESGGREDFPVHAAYHSTLAWVSTVFFFFGVTTLWPWLGQVYDSVYFWILVVGVLMPTLYLWGRLRQPRRQNSLEALIRFNRTLPYIGLILLIAILIG